MITYKILFKGNYSPEKIIWDEVASSRKIDDNLEKACKRYWKEMQDSAKKENKKLWDSDVYRLEKVDFTGNNLCFEVSTIPFSFRLAANKFTDTITNLGSEHGAFGMYSSCFVISKDNYLVFIEKSDNLFTTRKVSFVGGIFIKSEKEIIDGHDLFNAVIREIKEETGVDNKNVTNLALKAGYVSENYNVCLIFEAKIDISFNEIVRRFKPENYEETKRIFGFKATKPGLSLLFPEKDYPKFIISGFC